MGVRNCQRGCGRNSKGDSPLAENPLPDQDRRQRESNAREISGGGITEDWGSAFYLETTEAQGGEAWRRPDRARRQPKGRALDILWRMRMRMRKWVGLAAVSMLAVSMLACSHVRTKAEGKVEAAAAARERAMTAAKEKAEALDHERQELDAIPLPSKNQYMAIHTRSSWPNPFLVVTKSTVSLTMMYPKTGPAHAPGDAFLRPAAARRERLELRLSELPEALTALPQDVWPFGRVIAVEDDPSAPKKDRPQVRRNEEATLKMLSDLGVVAYEWPRNGR